MKIVRIILGIIVIALSATQLITGNSELLPYTMLFLGLMMLVIGIIELQKDRKGFGGYMCLAVSLFVFYVATQGFLI
ncbi:MULTISPECIES: DUF3953 domain-containing protein [Peribacillus]|uniref:DUF3953 domain-containing protein n=1 Tax=Peribacillus simplex TaxID=1478 RepID=A0AAW7IDL7_9BACI|nr:MULTISPECIES: DUF3953 domain-containing protein [Peribacillus]MDM5452107.1 DUF3953 domain-containing protein [Peribacillus simplex]MDV7765905.1 DUF3953 domain-containing protein [Peribacillus sp. CSMR9]